MAHRPVAKSRQQHRRRRLRPSDRALATPALLQAVAQAAQLLALEAPAARVQAVLGGLAPVAGAVAVAVAVEVEVEVAVEVEVLAR